MKSTLAQPSSLSPTTSIWDPQVGVLILGCIQVVEDLHGLIGLDLSQDICHLAPRKLHQRQSRNSTSNTSESLKGHRRMSTPLSFSWSTDPAPSRITSCLIQPDRVGKVPVLVVPVHGPPQQKILDGLDARVAHRFLNHFCVRRKGLRQSSANGVYGIVGSKAWVEVALGNGLCW